MEVWGKCRTEFISECCEPCQIIEKSKQADGFCGDCEEYMCHQCFKDHLTGKLCRNHVLKPVSRGNTERKKQEQAPVYCKTHISQPLRYYCRKHETIACGDCAVFNHQGCILELINSLAKNFQESSEFRDMLDKIQRLELDSGENETTLQRNKTESCSLTEKAILEIKKFRKEFNDYLDSAEADIIGEVKRASTANEDCMSKLEEGLTKLRLDVAELKNAIDAKLYQEDRLFIRFVENKVRIVDLEKCATDIKRRNNIEVFTFEPEQKLKEIIRSKVKLGSLKLVSQAKQEETLQREELSRERNPVKLKRDETRTQETEKSKISTEATFLSGQRYHPPDPRAAGLDIGKRVRYSYQGLYQGLLYDRFEGGGVITAVDPAGYVEVSWKSGHKSCESAGAGGRCAVRLI